MMTTEGDWIHFIEQAQSKPCVCCGDETKFTAEENEELYLCGLMCWNDYYMDSELDNDEEIY